MAVVLLLISLLVVIWPLVVQSAGPGSTRRLTTTTTRDGAISLPQDGNDDSIIIPQASLTVPMMARANSYHVYVYVGSPRPQRQTLIFDTGSRYTAFPCIPYCQNCGSHHHASRKFNGTQSTTLSANEYPNCIFAKKKKDPNRQDNACIFHQSYSEGSSWTAKEFEDVLWLAPPDPEESLEEYMPHLAIPFVFGCQTSVTGVSTNTVLYIIYISVSWI